MLEYCIAAEDLEELNQYIAGTIAVVARFDRGSVLAFSPDPRQTGPVPAVDIIR